MHKPKSIHFIGVKGVGVAPLSIIAKQAGIKVSGCDIADEFITDEPLKKAGITPLVGFSQDHLSGIDLVITTGAHGGYENEEVIAAKNMGIPVITQGQAVGEFMKGEILGRNNLKGISVTGSHGKTTTTAMIATVLAKNNCDPSYIIGTATVPSLDSCGHYGKGEYFVAEADEYATEPKYDKTPKFLWQQPKILVFTNIELDHPDLYPTIDDIRKAFLRFANLLDKDAVLIAYGDDPEIQHLLKEYKGNVITFGNSTQNDYRLSRITTSGGKLFFWVEHRGTNLGEFALEVVGEHNALNALATIVVGLEAGLTIEKIKQGLSSFTGSKRRFEFVGTLPSGALLYDDYAHHPTEIKRTLQAFRQKFPKQEIICIFQPHTYSRTKTLFQEFSQAFTDANTVILADIYPSLRESPDPTVSSQSLTENIKKFHKNAVYKASLQGIIEYLNNKKLGANTIVITMGAGDIYKISQDLLNPLKLLKQPNL